jgi:iron complex transport system substrate-binding protein
MDADAGPIRRPRIASLLAGATEVLYALGLADRIVAVSHECDFPPAALAKPRATRSLIDSRRPASEIDALVKERLSLGLPLYEIDRPLLAALRPDLIITQAQCDVCAVRYEDVLDLVHAEPALTAAQVLALAPASLADVLTDVQRIGEAAQASQAAAFLVSSLTSRIACIRQATAPLPPEARPTVVCLEWLAPLMTAGNWVPELVEMAGGRSRLAVAGRHSGYQSWEAVRQADPDVLLVAPCGFDLQRTLADAQRLATLPGWCDLKAVRSGRVFAIDGNAYISRSGPRLVDSLEILAHLFHPARFDVPRLATEVRLAFARLDQALFGS